MPRANWSTVRLTKCPSTIGIHFGTTLHSLLASWLQGQGTHITWSRQWVDFVLSWRVSAMRSQHRVILPWFSHNKIAFCNPTDHAIKSFYCILIEMSWTNGQTDGPPGGSETNIPINNYIVQGRYNDNCLLIGFLGINFNEIWIKMQHLS